MAMTEENQEQSEILNKLHYYHIWTSAYNRKYPAVCLCSIDGWDGKSKRGEDVRQWKFERLTPEDKEHILKHLGEYDDKYGFNIQIYSLDTIKWYKDLQELQEDMYIQILAGI